MTATFWEYDTRLGRRWNIDPVMKPWESPYSVLGGNPILNIDPLGNDWFKNNDGTIKYDPKVKSSKDLEDGQSYLGSVYNEKTKKGNANYREDGSIMFSNETDAYNRMWNVSKQPGGGTKTHEVFGAITKKGVLVLPDYKNDATTSEVEDYGYKFTNGNLYDPVSKGTIGLLGTIHTHGLKLDGGPSAAPSLQDINKFTRATPNKPFMTMGWDGQVHGAMGDKSGYSKIQLPKGYSTVSDLLKGASLIQLLKGNQK